MPKYSTWLETLSTTTAAADDVTAAVRDGIAVAYTGAELVDKAPLDVGDATIMYLVQYDPDDGWPDSRPAVPEGAAIEWSADVSWAPDPPTEIIETQDIVRLVQDPARTIVFINDDQPAPRPNHDGPVFWQDNSANAIAGDFRYDDGQWLLVED